ncbi:hypothetical protein [Streptomyces cavernicola]|uniref:Lipoprotein n=1 Tax=Streptomyces cavernicola TaxID=3043613 RepID=A0ABT6SBG7_9ACTN|nr:hypothetical protein [Streptomyces sp. B-S-A6]MDI3405543.1 hypothetical protein [Streptomyces sp. B-S-A6]
MSASDPRENEPQQLSMSALLAACAAARTVSTPPPAPDRSAARLPEPTRDDDRTHGHRDAA